MCVEITTALVDLERLHCLWQTLWKMYAFICVHALLYELMLSASGPSSVLLYIQTKGQDAHDTTKVMPPIADRVFKVFSELCNIQNHLYNSLKLLIYKDILFFKVHQALLLSLTIIFLTFIVCSPLLCIKLLNIWFYALLILMYSYAVFYFIIAFYVLSDVSLWIFFYVLYK